MRAFSPCPRRKFLEGIPSPAPALFRTLLLILPARRRAGSTDMVLCALVLKPRCVMDSWACCVCMCFAIVGLEDEYHVHRQHHRHPRYVQACCWAGMTYSNWCLCSTSRELEGRNVFRSPFQPKKLLCFRLNRPYTASCSVFAWYKTLFYSITDSLPVAHFLAASGIAIPWGCPIYGSFTDTKSHNLVLFCLVSRKTVRDECAIIGQISFFWEMWKEL